VRIVQLALSDYHQLPSILDNFVEEVKAIGPNPYKGM
jgi:quinone-modifying oxidoreductase subunit QmoB